MFTENFTFLKLFTTKMMKKWFLSISVLIIFLSVTASLYSADNFYGLLINSGDKADSKPIATFVSNQKSPVKAFLFSTAIPGTGELYTGSKKGIVFMTTEVVFWTAYVILHGRHKDLNSSYKKYVREHIAFEDDSPTKSFDNWNMEDYEHATQTGNWHYVYIKEADVERLGKFYWKDLPQDKIDEPGEDIMTPYRKEAYSKRGSANTKNKQAKICLSLIVANHVASAIDARISTIFHNKKSQQTTISIRPFITPNSELSLYVSLNNSF